MVGSVRGGWQVIMIEPYHSAKHMHMESKAMLLLRDLPTSCTASPLEHIRLCYFSLATTNTCKNNTSKALLHLLVFIFSSPSVALKYSFPSPLFNYLYNKLSYIYIQNILLLDYTSSHKPNSFLMPKASILEFQPAASAYFGELEEALIHGTRAAVDPSMIGSEVHTKCKTAGYVAARPPTLEIFPSWPMSHLQQPYSGNSQSVGSTTDSSSGQNAMPQAELVSPVSMMRADSGQQQEVLMVTVDDYNYEQGLGATATTAPIFEQHTAGQDKRKHGSTRKDGKLLDAKTEKRLAQNREAARKSRLRKKAYVQQLETSRIRLQQIEQELQGARSQGLFPGGCSAPGDMSSGAVMFDMEYARWLEDDSKHLTELQGVLQAQLIDSNLGAIVEDCMRHYDELFHLRAVLARSDVFHLMTGMWAASAERCFLWMGGFRPSEILKMLIPQLDPLTEQQLLGMCNLQRSSEQAEEALVQGLQQLHQSLADAVGASPLSDGANVANYTALMALALDRFDTLERFYRQADSLRQQTLHHMRRILTTRQAARCFLSIGEYHRRLRALSSVWASRPRESFVAAAENASPTGTTEQVLHVYHPSQFSGF